jgi:uncharacterized protein YbbC (DUF1343 family)
VTNDAVFKPFLTGLALIATARRHAPRDFAWRRPPYEFERRRLPIDILLGTDVICRAMESGRRLGEIAETWRRPLAAWKRRRAPFLLYR